MTPLRSCSVWLCAWLCAAALACRDAKTERAPEAASSAGVTGTAGSEAKPKFEFALPADYTRLELRGEGSEILRAPPGARVEARANAFHVVKDPDFALSVHSAPLPLAEIAARVESARRVHEDEDLIVFQSAHGFGFVLLRELVPEWDENDPRRLACTSAGIEATGGKTSAQALRFHEVAIENMVAACRSLELPPLE